MLRVGLTGGIATGKTTVGQMFVELGCHLIDSDEIAHQLFEPGQDVHAAVIDAFGPTIVAADGTIDRKILGEIVFKDSASRAKLNQLVHPAIIRRQQEFLAGVARKDQKGIGIVSAALMIEDRDRHV
jgi:dephospho-CoA kinase